MKKSHTDRMYETELRRLRELILLMAGKVEKMIAQSVKALVDHDIGLANDTIEADHQVNHDEIKSDELCLIILAKRQPMALDLRFITLALKMVTDLERIGDLAVNIAERVTDLGSELLLPKLYVDIPRMAAIVQSMIRDAIDAFVAGDVEKAHDVVDRDDEVDELYTRIFRELLGIMRDESKVKHGMHIQSVAKVLERMADHCTNLAEQVIFMVKGKDIRHIGKLGQN
ncbi:Phosphate transport system regulatory protein PhoU [Olavius algarvensis spirochete endosymbiont]|uniref:phosphate signaling complex protein PhoU n=1 Tax=Olavius algarvensis spirochete endosymbiont TaxID=260710 RepID=UPI000F14EE6C|nr:phosphate signaling complex protein PhoU [Olavius algarvensis spirochete endosymbiont]VDB00448.1 Phosphate transport system regulatory protein PhoU [Olavius algarvensis spirochete endosymbiont]